MKKILFCLIAIWSVYCNVNAQEYQLSEIEDIAESFFNQIPQYAPELGGGYHPMIKQIASIEPIIQDSTNYMYIVNATDSLGWVIISNEKAYTTIIAYGDNDNFTYDRETLPPAMIRILDNHINAIDSVRIDYMHTLQDSADITQASITPQISPTFLKNVKWKQSMNNDHLSADCDKVYNKFCPKLVRDSCIDIFEADYPYKPTCNRKLAGCGAIAMAQLMKYWQWPDCAKIDKQTYYYDWKNMPNKINNSTDMYQVDEVARLIENCRTAANSFGGCLWTAAEISKIHDAMIEVFGYHSNLVRPKKEKRDRALMIVNEINLGRPIIVQAMGDSLLAEWHTFIIDGYRIDDNDDNGIADTTFHVNFGAGGNNSTYFNLQFNGYCFAQVYLIELYPNCNTRSNDVSISSPLTIAANDNRTYYSTNNVTLSSNNNSIVVDNGGHLLVKAGNEVRLKPGFHAKAGSNIHIMINDTMCSSPQISSAPQRMAARSSSATTDDTESTNDTPTNNTLEDMGNNMIQSTTIYTISGQLIQTISGGQHDAVQLPNGMYVLQHRMSDGSMRSEKIANNK